MVLRYRSARPWRQRALLRKTHTGGDGRRFIVRAETAWRRAAIRRRQSYD